MTDIDFGDFDVEDAFDNAGPDPLQVAMRLHRYRRYLAQLSGDDLGDYFDLSEFEQDRSLDLANFIVEWVGDHPVSDRARLARAIHEHRRDVDGAVVEWGKLAPDLKQVAQAIGKALGDWLIRQGSWQ